MLHTREKQTRRFAALSEHLHASTRLGVQCINALILCVWPDHACLSLWQQACSVHKQGVMLRLAVLGAVGDALAHLWRGLWQSA